MTPKNNIFLKLLSFSLITVGATACHSSKNVVRVDNDVPKIKVDINEMRSDVKSRSYQIPQINALISEATRWLGVPYRYAGNDMNGVDCSGLTSQVYLKSLKVKMPRNSREQQRWCLVVEKNELIPGDLVFFATGSDKNRVSHVGIYIGNGDIIHASSRGVIISSLNEKYYLTRYHSSGRPEIIQQLYASSAKNNAIDSESNTILQPTDNEVISYPDSDALSISLEDFIELQIDSVAAMIESKTDTSTVSPLVSPIKSTNSVSPKQSSNKFTKRIEAPTTNEENTDTVFIQFFD